MTRNRAHASLVDETIEAYVRWREECAAVWDAYRLWLRAPVADVRVAFGAYRAGLDREEHAAQVYAALMSRLGTAEPAATAP